VKRKGRISEEQIIAIVREQEAGTATARGVPPAQDLVSDPLCVANRSTAASRSQTRSISSRKERWRMCNARSSSTSKLAKCLMLRC
jgi:hypothetical protein